MIGEGLWAGILGGGRYGQMECSGYLHVYRECCAHRHGVLGLMLDKRLGLEVSADGTVPVDTYLLTHLLLFG